MTTSPSCALNMLHFPYTETITSAYFLQFCFGISIRQQRANLWLSCQKMKHGAIDTMRSFHYSVHNIKSNVATIILRTVKDRQVCVFSKDFTAKSEATESLGERL